MARNPAKILDHLLISTAPEDTIDGFEIDGVTYKILKSVPAEAILELTSASSSAQGMLEYILACLPDEAQKESFSALKNRMGVDGYGAVIEEIVELTTPFGGEKSKD